MSKATPNDFYGCKLAVEEVEPGTWPEMLKRADRYRIIVDRYGIKATPTGIEYDPEHLTSLHDMAMEQMNECLAENHTGAASEYHDLAELAMALRYMDGYRD